MSKKRKQNDDTVSDFPEQEAEPTVNTLEDPARALVEYLRHQERTDGITNTAHGTLLVHDVTILNDLVTNLEAALLPPPPEPEEQEVIEPNPFLEPPTPVSASADLSGSGKVNRIDE
jgi:hypothetical protein